MGGCITSALTGQSAVEVAGAVLGTVSSRARRGIGALAARRVAAPDRPQAGQTGTVGTRLGAADRWGATASTVASGDTEGESARWLQEKIDHITAKLDAENERQL
jgi:hypothetical protein